MTHFISSVIGGILLVLVLLGTLIDLYERIKTKYVNYMNADEDETKTSTRANKIESIEERTQSPQFIIDEGEKSAKVPKSKSKGIFFCKGYLKMGGNFLLNFGQKLIKEPLLVRVLLCFSAYTNTLKIFNVEKSNGEHFDCLHALRTTSCMWYTIVILRGEN
jgi:hypothetical protein